MLELLLKRRARRPDPHASRKRRKKKKRRRRRNPPRPQASSPTRTPPKPPPAPVAPPAVAPPRVPPPQPPPQPPPAPKPDGTPPIYSGDLGRPDLKRLLWRAGFGPRPGDIDALASKPLEEVVHSLTRPTGTANLVGPEPRDSEGPLAPFDAWGHDHLWWLDRMVRSDQPLVERMTLIFHDWFATSNENVGSAKLMIDQNQLFRANALGSFRDILMGVTKDPAMLLFLNGIDNRKGWPNENYARELMELFALGAGRGYTETDVRQLALCLTGWRATWVDGTGWTNFRYDPNRHDTTTKTVFGKSGNFGWEDAVRLVLENPYHASFFVTKLWSYFIPTPPDGPTQAALQQLYLDSGYGIRPVVEAILKHPDFYNGGSMVKPPVVYNAGMLRAVGRAVDTYDWVWLCDTAGQQLFYPPNVSGWDDTAWLDTSRWRARWWIANYVLGPKNVDPWKTSYNTTEDASTALKRALGALGNPVLTSETHAALSAFSASCLPSVMSSWQHSPYRAMRLNALRQLVATCPDYQTS